MINKNVFAVIFISYGNKKNTSNAYLYSKRKKYLVRSSPLLFSRSSLSRFLLSALSRASLLRSLASFFALTSILNFFSCSSKYWRWSWPFGIFFRNSTKSFHRLNSTRKTDVWNTDNWSNISNHISKQWEESWKYAAEYFWRNSRSLEMWWNTVSSIWYIFSIETKTKE